MILLVALLACREPVPVPKGVPRSEDPRPAWGAVLAGAVTDDGRVDLARLAEGKEALARYLGWLRKQKPPDDFRPELAFWLDAHLAMAMHALLWKGAATPDEVPGFFHRLTFRVQKDEVSLFEIEHERLRGRSLEYRLHAGLYAGRPDDPPPRPGLYDADAVLPQLDQQLRRWVADPDRGVRVDGDEVVAHWRFVRHRRDFEVWSGGRDLCDLLADYAEPPLSTALRERARSGCRVRARR